MNSAASLLEKPSLQAVHNFVLAAYHNDVRAAQAYIARYPQYLDLQDHDGKTALCLAIRRQCHDVLQVLLRGGADVNARDTSKNTPLHWAVVVQDRDAVLSLIDAGADLAAKDATHQTPLEWAVNNDFPRDIIRILQEAPQRQADNAARAKKECEAAIRQRAENICREEGVNIAPSDLKRWRIRVRPFK